MLHGPGNWYNSRRNLFFVRSLRKFINVDGVGFATSFHRRHTGTCSRGGNATTAVEGADSEDVGLLLKGDGQ